MKTNELSTDLRIGNWIKYEDKLVQVVQLSSLMILCQKDENQFLVNCAPEVFQPIELTEEVLLKIGFKKVFQSKVTKGRFELNVDMGDNEFRNIVYHIYASGNTNLNITQRRCASLCDDSMDKSGIKYLHQLQNAYFILTGEELNIEL